MGAFSAFYGRKHSSDYLTLPAMLIGAVDRRFRLLPESAPDLR